MSANQDEHLQIAFAFHNTLAMLTEALCVPMPAVDDSILDDMLLAYDKFGEVNP